MKSRLWILVLTAALLFTSACSSGDVQSQVETGIAQTQRAQDEQSHVFTITPSPTIEPTQTNTPTVLPPTPTIESTSTYTPTPLPTATPDLRIIVGKPEEFILLREDLPDEYILRPGSSSPHENKEVVAIRGVEEGKAYLDATGRIGGWIIWYKLVDSTAIAPEWIESYIVMYDNPQGCLTAKSPKWDKTWEKYSVVAKEMDLGDWNRVLRYRVRQPNGKYYVYYEIEFCYRNVYASIYGEGMESDVRHEYTENLARKVLAKLEAAPLGFP
jgi:hypothetical protein